MLEDDESTVDAGAEDAPESLGDRLRGARAAQELSIEQVAAELRIETRLLTALEAHRFEALGAPVFAKGYLKQYAHRLGLSYDDLLAEYYRLADPRDVTIEPSRSIKLRDERQITVWIIAGLALLLVAVFLFVWWISQPEATFSVSSEATDTLDPIVDAPQAVPAASAARDAPPPEAAVQPEPAAPSEPAGQSEAAASRGDAASVSTGNAPAAVALPALEPVAEFGSDSAQTGPLIRVVMNFEQDSWADVTDGTGQRLFYGLGRAGTRSVLAGAPPVDVLLGNADGVRLVVDNEPYAVPAGARQGNLARFTLDARD